MQRLKIVRSSFSTNDINIFKSTHKVVQQHSSKLCVINNSLKGNDISKFETSQRNSNNDLASDPSSIKGKIVFENVYINNIINNDNIQNVSPAIIENVAKAMPPLVICSLYQQPKNVNINNFINNSSNLRRQKNSSMPLLSPIKTEPVRVFNNTSLVKTSQVPSTKLKFVKKNLTVSLGKLFTSRHTRNKVIFINIRSNVLMKT
jgi:hypothetical protein